MSEDWKASIGFVLVLALGLTFGLVLGDAYIRRVSLEDISACEFAGYHTAVMDRERNIYCATEETLVLYRGK